MLALTRSAYDIYILFCNDADTVRHADFGSESHADVGYHDPYKIRT